MAKKMTRKILNEDDLNNFYDLVGSRTFKLNYLEIKKINSKETLEYVESKITLFDSASGGYSLYVNDIKFIIRTKNSKIYLLDENEEENEVNMFIIFKRKSLIVRYFKSYNEKLSQIIDNQEFSINENKPFDNVNIIKKYNEMIYKDFKKEYHKTYIISIPNYVLEEDLEDFIKENGIQVERDSYIELDFKEGKLINNITYITNR